MQSLTQPEAVIVCTAAWGLPASIRDRPPPAGSALARYAGLFQGVEINSSFYKPHRRKTYERWASSTPEGFRFAVKAPQEITHHRRLIDVAAPLSRFFDEIAGLGEKLGPVLLQSPPSLSFQHNVAEAFFNLWRAHFQGATVIEPRHPSWFSAEAEALLIARKIARVAADPAPVAAAAAPGGWSGLRYLRLHGSPHIYASSYDLSALTALAAQITAPAFVVFDNTKFGAAAQNALTLEGLLTRRRPRLSPEPTHAW